MASQGKISTRKNHGSVHWARLRQLFSSRNKTLKFGDSEGLDDNGTSGEDESPLSLRRQPKSYRIFINPSSNELRRRHPSGDGQPSIKTTPRSRTTLTSPFPASDKFRQRSLRWSWKRKIDEPLPGETIEDDEGDKEKQDEDQSENIDNEKAQDDSCQQSVIHQPLSTQDTKIERTSEEAKDVEPSAASTSPISITLSHSHQSLVEMEEAQDGKSIYCSRCKRNKSSEVGECTECSNNSQTEVVAEDAAKAKDFPEELKSINDPSLQSNIISHTGVPENELDLNLQLSSVLVPISTDGCSLQNEGSNESDKMLIVSPKPSKPNLTFIYSKSKARNPLRKVQSANDGDCPWGLKSKDTDSFEFGDRGTLRGFRMTDFGAVLKQRKGTGIKLKSESDEQDSESETELISTGPVELHKDDFIDFSSQKTRWKVNWGKEI